MCTKDFNALAISGSLRAQSSNSVALNALARVINDHVKVVRYREIDSLPHFNPDVEEQQFPESVSHLQALLDQSEALILSCPEYAHGVPGAFKNALDWLVGVGLGRRPVMLINTSPSAFHAQNALKEIIRTMDGVIVQDACIDLPLLGKRLSAEQILGERGMLETMKRGLRHLVAYIESNRRVVD